MPDVETPLELRLLGGFEALCQDEAVRVAPASAQLLSLLVLSRRRSHRSTLAGTLWPDTTESRANANLRAAVWRLGDHGRDIVSASGGWLALSARVVADVESVEERSRRLVRGDSSNGELDLDARDLDEDLLPGWDQPWVLLERERFRQLRLYALEALANQLVGLGRIAEAVLAAVVAVQADPLRESAHRTLILAHLADGNSGEAARQYKRFSELLAKEMGIRPSEELAMILKHVIGQ